MPVQLGYDPDGAQVQVETGTGVVTRIDGLGAADETGEHRNYRVILSATHSARMRQPVTALTTRGEPTLAAARAAMASGQPVDYTIQLRRRAEVDPTIPIETLKATAESARDKLRRVLTTLGEATSSEAVAVTRHIPTTGNGAGSAVVVALITDLLGALAAGDGARLDLARAALTEVAPAGVEALMAAARQLPAATEPAVEVAARPRPRSSEVHPNEAYDHSQRINLGSYTALAGVGTAELAYQLLAERGEVDRAVLELLAKGLVWASGQVQRAATGRAVATGERSHTRARGLVHTIAAARPLPQVLTPDSLRPWLDELIVAANDLHLLGLSLVYTADDLAALPAGLRAVNSGAAEVARQATPADEQGDTGGWPKHGEATFVAPKARVRERFRSLVADSGLPPQWVQQWLATTFGDAEITRVYGPGLEYLLEGVDSAAGFTALITGISSTAANG